MRQRRLPGVPTFSAENKRIWSGAIMGSGAAVLWVMARLLPPGWGWGTAGGIAWVLFYVAAYFAVNRPGLYNRSAVEAQLKVLIELLDLPPSDDFRAVIWAPRGERQEGLLEQVTNYVPNPDVDRAPGRLLGAAKGITGHAFRNRADTVNLLPKASFPDDESLIRHHVDRWGFDYQEARQLKAGRRSQLAVPVVDVDQKVLGVIYCDSSQEGTCDSALAALVAGLAPLFRQVLLLKGD
jgi:hypothetical protein